MTYNDNQNYQRFLKQKNKIKERYAEDIWNYKVDRNNFNRKEYQKYLKEIVDLMYKPNSNYQKFLWDIISPSDKKKMDSLANANHYGRKNEFNYY